MRKIRLASLGVLVAFVFSAFSWAVASEPSFSYEEMILSNTYPITNEVLKEISLQRPALEAYNDMLDGFFCNYGAGVYPVNYAGAYITENNKLCILLTDDAKVVREEYYDYCQSSEVLVFEKAEFSYAELENTYNELNYKEIKNFSNAYIDVMDNNVKVAVTTVVPDVEKQAVNDTTMVEIVYEPAVQTETVQLYGGTELNICTLGGCGTYQGQNAVVLCGHGFEEGDSLKLASGTTFATVVLNQYATDENYDYSVATINAGADVTLSNKVKNASGYTTITSESSYIPAVNSTVCMYGATGGFGVGKVIALSSVLHDERLGVDCYGLVKCEWNEGQEAYGAGSSGGPVYAGHVFHGTYSGSNGTGGKFWFSPINAVPSFSIRTS